MNKTIGAQLYTLRDYMTNLEDFEAMCKKISAIGYKAVQVSGTPLAAKDIKPILDAYNLDVYTTHKGYDDFVNNIDGVIEYNKTLGSTLCGLGMTPHDMCKSMDGLKDGLAKLNRACEELAKEGLSFGLHNHAIEFSKLDGKFVYDYFINETDPTTFKFIVDTYWLQAGGVSQVETIKKLGERAEAIHFKDFEIVAEDWEKPRFAAIGTGNLDWDSIIKACDEAGSKWILIEEDVCPKDPFECLKDSYNYLTKKGFN